MNSVFSKFPDIKYKRKEDIEGVWETVVTPFDYRISEILKAYGVEMEFLYTTNVGLLNMDLPDRSVVLWDISYWAFYKKYLEFVFWMEKEAGESETLPALYPRYIREIVCSDQNLTYGNRLTFLATMFEYLACKFYSNENLSYCFALLYNINRCTVGHIASDAEYEQYRQYISEQSDVVKLFCALHEAYHLDKIKTSVGSAEFRRHVLYNVKLVVNSNEFELCYKDSLFVDAVRKRINDVDCMDGLFDELYADAAALDFMVNLFVQGYVWPDWTMERFCNAVREAINNFYSYNSLTYELYCAWDQNVLKKQGKVSKKVYREEILAKDTEEAVRGQMLPAILCMQLNILQEEYSVPLSLPDRRVNVRKEMIDFFNIAYNDKLKNAILHAIKSGFENAKLKVSEARDVLLLWEPLSKYPNISTNDLFLHGGKTHGTDFFMFVARY